MNMPLSLDHVVILVTDLEAAISDYSALGFTVQRGGSHADGATHNALVGFADGSYLELIAFLKPAPQHRWAAAAQRGVPGYIDFALLPSSVAEVVEAARARGLGYQGPVDGGRLRPDGERLQWQTGVPPSPDLPFLCCDVTPRALRVREGDVRQHANGVQGVALVSVLVRDLAESVARYQALLGAQAPRQVSVRHLAGLDQQLALLPLGDTTLALVAPSAGAAADAPLPSLLAQRGEGVLGLTLRGAVGGKHLALSRTLAHGAAMDIASG